MKKELKDKKLILASMKHWEEDIIKRFERGDEVLCNFIWKSDETVIKASARFCSLCGEYMDGVCHRCPYTLFYKTRCCDSRKEEGRWWRFYKAPCLRTAKSMYNALANIIDAKHYQKESK